MGLYSFMLDSDITNGSIESSDEDKRQLAKSSLEFNTTNKYAMTITSASYYATDVSHLSLYYFTLEYIANFFQI